MAAEEHNGGGSPSESPTKVEHSFDELARALAEGSISRRRALKLFAGTALAALIPSRALAQPKKVTICHKPGTPEEKTIEVSQRAVATHRGHGDTLGACGESTTTTSTSTSTSSTTSTSTSTSTTTPTPSTSTTTPMCLPNGSSPCDAGSECCSGLCDGGMCSACQDASECTPPDNQCQQATCTNGVCGVETAPDGTPCDDNNECTIDVCEAGVCVSTLIECCGDPCPTDGECCDGTTCVGDICTP